MNDNDIEGEEDSDDEVVSHVNELWFVPSFPPRDDRPHEMIMLTEWTNVMIYEDYFQEWMTRLESILSSIPAGPTERAGCIATSFAVWLSMPIGHSFINKLFMSFNKKEYLHRKREAAVKAWAEENMMGKCTTNLLLRIVNERKEYFEVVTYDDHRAVEATLSWCQSKARTASCISLYLCSCIMNFSKNLYIFSKGFLHG